MSKAKAMGTSVETASCKWLVEHGFPECERLVLAGAADRGDLRLQHHPTVIAECKRAQRGVNLTSWMNELGVEITNSGAETGILIAKQKGAGDKSAFRWFAAMHAWRFDAAWKKFLTDATSSVTSWAIAIARMQELSPMKVNTEFVTNALSTARHGEWIPFAKTYRPGNPAVEYVIGPLWQFTELLLDAGYGKRE